MVVIQCVDNRNGILFNRRRQSQDRLLRARILSKLEGRRLWMNGYSFRQFQKDTSTGQVITVDAQFLSKAQAGEVCFVEGLPLRPLAGAHRTTPFYLPPLEPGYSGGHLPGSGFGRPSWSLVSQISGSSHPTITEEVYLP